MADPNLIRQHVTDPDLVGLSNDDAAAALNEPVLTRRPDRVTVTTLASSAVWGKNKTGVFLQKLQAAAAAGSADAVTALAVLSGPGLDANDQESRDAAAAFVAAGLATLRDAQAALYLVSYRCGSPDVTAQGVADARAALARSADVQSRRQLAADQYNATVTFLDATEAGDGPAPSEADVLARLGTAGA